MTTTRRTFLRQAAIASGGLLAAPALLAKRNGAWPADQIRVGLIGCRNMGFGDLVNCLKQEGVVCGGLCDVDEEVLNKRAADIERDFGTKPRLYRDFRKMLEDPDLDAVVIGTPDHWHCLATVLACEAGKAVYVEKPVANSIGEAEAMVAATRRYKRIVQVGQQQRSGQMWQEVVAYVQAGSLGPVRRVMLWGNFPYGMGNPRIADSQAPAHLDYAMWLGPAADLPYNANRLHGAWRHTWAFGGGLVTDWGVHLLDVVLWAMGATTPKKVTAAGGILQYHDRLIETPDTLDVTWDMGSYLLTWSHNAGSSQGQFGKNYGIAFQGTEGTLVVNRQGWEVLGKATGDSQEVLKPHVAGQDADHLPHAADFIQAMREGRDPICPIEKGRDAAVLAQYAVLAHRTGKTLYPATQPADFSDMPEVQGLVMPVYHHGWALP